MPRNMRITSSAWLGKVLAGGGVFHIRIAVNLVG